jgi:phytoene synthase
MIGERLATLLGRDNRPGGHEASIGFWNKLSERSHSNLYFALIFLDRRRRNAFRDVYRFVRAADDVADAPGDPEENIARLAAWRRQLDTIYEPLSAPGRRGDRRQFLPDTDASAHPYALRLRRAVAEYGLSRRHFETLLDGLEMDVRTPRWPDYAALRAYCEAVASSLAHLCLQILGASGAAEDRYAHDVGIALQLANILRDVREDAARNHIYLPQDELRAAGVAEEDVLAGRASPGLSAVCRGLARRAEGLIASARQGLTPRCRRRLLVPEIWADVYLDLLAELDGVDYDVFENPPYLRRRRKLAIALRRWASDVSPGWAARFFPRRLGLW